MPGNYDNIDFDWSFDGDLIIDDDGDIKDTSDDHIRSLLNEIQTIVKSETQDWRDNPEVGAGLSDFIGEPNDRTTARDLQARLENAIGLIVNRQDLSVRIIPFHIHKVAILIAVQALSTPNNSLTSFTPITLHFVFDYQESGLYITTDSMDHFAQVRDTI